MRYSTRVMAISTIKEEVSEMKAAIIHEFGDVDALKYIRMEIPKSVPEWKISYKNAGLK